MENVVIIGTGCAGLTAAIYTARANLKPLVLTGTMPGGLLTTTSIVENFPGFPEGVDGYELMTRMQAQAEKFGAQVKFATVDSVKFGDGVTELVVDGEPVQTRTLIIASGAGHKHLDVPGEDELEKKGVTYCATCDGELPMFRNQPVMVVGGGADLRRFQPPADRLALRAEWGIREGDFLFLTVRRLDPRMGLKLVIKAFSAISAEFPKARLWLAGRGRQQAELAADIEGAGLGDQARLLGFVPEEKLSGLYAAADCVLMPSLDLEGFGLVTAEALACGTPVAASRAGANAEVIEGLSPALLFSAGDPVALTHKLREILASPAGLPSRDRCAAYARERFRWDRPADACERAWDRLAI
jgi:glycosyltransferase involved in cell wall biosynthesis